jgi:hypothetical protein
MWLSPVTFLLWSGPKGSGKTTLLRSIMRDRNSHNCVRIDCAAARLTDTSGATVRNVYLSQLCVCLSCAGMTCMRCLVIHVTQDTGSTFLDVLERAIGFWPSFSTITEFSAYFESFFPMKKNGTGRSIDA